MKRALAAIVITGAFVGMSSGVALADGNGVGSDGTTCKLSDGTTFDNRGQMISYLAHRDGSIENTVTTYHFDGVAGLIDKKCS
jgi:hypothetical protein